MLVCELYYTIMAAGTERVLLNKRLGRVAQVMCRAVSVQHAAVVMRRLDATGVCTVNLLTPHNFVTTY